MNYYIDAWKNYLNFEGRARRKAYWLFVLFNIIAMIVAVTIDNILGSAPIFQALYTLAIFLPSISIAVRRLHDTGKSGWWILISLIPFFGGLILLIFLCLDSQPGTNEYGPNPKEA